MSTNKTTEQSIARQKRNIAWMIFSCMLTMASFSAYKWYATPSSYTAESSVSIPGENTPADFWTYTGLVSAKTKATEIISSESFVTSAFQNTPAPALTQTDFDYATKSETNTFPFDIKVTKTPATGSQRFQITDAGDSTYLLKGQNETIAKSFIGTYGSEVQLGDYSFIIDKKTDSAPAPEPFHTDISYSFSLMSNQAITQYLLSGEGDLSVSQLNDVIQVSVTANGDGVSTDIANTLAKAYQNTINNHSETTVPSAKTPVEQITPTINPTPLASDGEQIATLVETLTALEAAQKAQESLTRNIRERIEEDYSGLPTEGIESEEVTRGLRKLGELYNRLERHPGDSEILTSISERKQKIGDELIKVRKETALQIEKTKDDIKELGGKPVEHQEASSVKMVPSEEATSLRSNTAAAMLIPATTMEANKNTPAWAWITAFIGLGLILMSNRITVFQNRYRLLKNAETAPQNKVLPVTYPVKTVMGTNVALTQPVENLCAELLTKDQVKTITVTSLKSGEGKTFVASRLAMCLAALDKKVLVVDMSFNKPSMSKTLSCETEFDICDVAAGRGELLQAIVPTSLPGMDLLTAGSFDHGIRGFLAWTDRETSFKQLRNYYDYIIIDTDDVSSGPEAVTFLKMSDLNLFIDGSGVASKEKNEKIADFTLEKGLLNNFVVPNIITKKAPVNTSVKTTERSSHKTIRMTAEKQASTSNDGANEKPSLLKRVALWFF